MKWFLRMVNVPNRCLLHWHIGEGIGPFPHHMPFDFVGILVEDEYIEMVEPDEFEELVGKNS